MGKNVSETAYFVSDGTQNLNSINQSVVKSQDSAADDTIEAATVASASGVVVDGQCAYMEMKMTSGIDDVYHDRVECHCRHVDALCPAETWKPLPCTNRSSAVPVSYTHLTLPTIYSV